MKKDNYLKSNDYKLVFLLVGNKGVGKADILQHLKSSILNQKINFDYDENKSYYYTYYFNYNDNLDNINVSIPLEIRVIHGEDMENNLKNIAPYFKNAYGSFILTSINDYISFQDGVKWKEKLDLMCCLPNKFPSPVYLLINKSQHNDRNESRNIMDINYIESYVSENQFFKYFFINTNKGIEVRDTLGTNISILSSDIDFPFLDMINTILSFKDIKQKFINKTLLINSKISKSSKKEKCNIL